MREDSSAKKQRYFRFAVRLLVILIIMKEIRRVQQKPRTSE
jgi:hypothetical protein